MKIAIIGGGPAGLYFARLMKRHQPAHQIEVIEQNPFGATYGFGVTLGGPARERMKATDPEVADALAALMHFNNKQRICLDGEDVLVEYASYGGAIERLKLLGVLQKACLDLGIALHHQRRVEDLSAFAAYDLIVGADGPNSVVRGTDPAAFGTHSYSLTNPFAWYGVAKAMKPNALVFRHTKDGVFVGHYYAYKSDMSTFVAECDAKTWTQSGFDRLSDPERKSTIEAIFADHLQGEPLVENKSIWRTFKVVVNERWFSGNRVLIGDALRSAHFSIGSGTRLAMEDALALFEAFSEHGEDLAKVLPRYVEIRKPIRDLFGVATERSFNWYENVRQAMAGGDVWDFTHDFLTRTGRVDDKRLKDYAPSFYADYMRRKNADARSAAVQ